MSSEIPEAPELVLAAEDFEPNEFDKAHTFSTRNDRRILLSLTAHGPVLLRGGRGTGKSAFMIAASRQLAPANPDGTAIGIYMSLRHAPLLKSTGERYGKILCEIVIRKIKDTLLEKAAHFDPEPDVASLQHALTGLAVRCGKRLVLFFDDAAHLGREASLEEFFDIYRTLSSNSVSCKAAIYPGVTRFGTRFDVYNDATVVDLLRSEELPGFVETFSQTMASRYPGSFTGDRFRADLGCEQVASFLAQCTLGNMRGFIFACNSVSETCGATGKIGLPELGESLVRLSRNYYWPLLEEIRPKLGKYEPMVPIAQQVAEAMFEECGKKPSNPRDVMVHREVDERLSRPLQILEYAGFISRREASRAMKSGGRGARYAVNLCNLLETKPGARLTKELFDSWMSASREEAVQFGRSSRLTAVEVPTLPQNAELAIFAESIRKLGKSSAYPYGLTEKKIDCLMDAGIATVGDLAEADDDDLDAIPSVGPANVARIRNVLGQAIWM